MGSRTSADGCGGSVTSRLTRPCSFSSSSGVTAQARSIISLTAGSWCSISARSSSLSACTCRTSASSISVLSNRLPRLSGAICGWSGRTIAAPSITSSCRRGEHRPGVDAVAGGVELREEAPAPRRAAIGWVEISERAIAAGAVEAGRAPRCGSRRGTRPAARPPLERRHGEPRAHRQPADAEVAAALDRAAARPGGARRSARGSAPRAVTSPPPSTTQRSSRWS